MEGPQLDAAAIDSAALPVRRGNKEEVERLCKPFAGGGGTGFARILRGRIEPPGPAELLAASEALELRGLHMEALHPLEILIDLSGEGGPLELSAARFGTLTLLHGLTADVRPIARTLGIDGRPSRGKVHWPEGRGPEDVLPAVERLIFGSLLLHRTAMNISSAKERSPYLQASNVWLSNALDGAMSLDGPARDFHTARCRYISGILTDASGQRAAAYDALSECVAISKRCKFPGLQALALLRLSPMVLDSKERVGALLLAEDVLRGFGNHLLSNEARFLRGMALSEEAASEGGIAEGIGLMLSSADGLKRAGYEEEAAVKEVYASLWLARAGRAAEALPLVRGALKVLRKARDDEMAALAMATGFVSLIRKGERKRAKRTLLDLVLRYPVKQFPEVYEVLKEGVSGQEWLRKDPQTSEMFDEMPVYTIERGALNEIIARAREAHPNEFGAMLRGTARITHIEPILDTAAGRSTVMFSLYDRLSQRSIPGEGVVHSHPSGSTRPSKADLQMFSRFPGINIIIGFPYTEDTLAAYDRLGNIVELRTV